MVKKIKKAFFTGKKASLRKEKKQLIFDELTKRLGDLKTN